jgi:hypothetical protein
VILDFRFESALPPSQTRWLVIEDEIIPFLPDRPGTNHEDLHEKRLIENMLGRVNLMVNGCVLIPNKAKGKPSGD